MPLRGIVCGISKVKNIFWNKVSEKKMWNKWGTTAT